MQIFSAPSSSELAVFIQTARNRSNYSEETFEYLKKKLDSGFRDEFFCRVTRNFKPFTNDEQKIALEYRKKNSVVYRKNKSESGRMYYAYCKGSTLFLSLLD